MGLLTEVIFYGMQQLAAVAVAAAGDALNVLRIDAEALISIFHNLLFAT